MVVSFHMLVLRCPNDICLVKGKILMVFIEALSNQISLFEKNVNNQCTWSYIVGINHWDVNVLHYQKAHKLCRFHVNTQQSRLQFLDEI